MAFVEYVNNTVIGRVHRDTRDPCTNLYARLHKSIVFFFLFFRSFLSFPLLSSFYYYYFPSFVAAVSSLLERQLYVLYK